MEKYSQKKVYIISGPPSVGKSTIANSLTANLTQSAYIPGDIISHMYIGREKEPRRSKRESVLTWYNILSLTKNFIMFNIDTIIDFVTFPNEALWLSKKLQNMPVEISYVILWTDQETLLKRDQLKPVNERMKEQCLISHNQFSNEGFSDKHYFNTTKYSLNDVSFITNEILTNRTFLLD